MQKIVIAMKVEAQISDVYIVQFSNKEPAKGEKSIKLLICDNVWFPLNKTPLHSNIDVDFSIRK